MNKLILDGVEYGLSDSLVAKLKEEIAINDAVRRDQTVFDRVRIGDTYYCIGIDGTISAWKEGYDNSDTNLYCNANYCRDAGMMSQRALHETLNRLLWRYSEEHGGDETWNNNRQHYFISLNYPYEELFVNWALTCKTPGVVFFADKNAAQAAIEEVVKPFLAKHPEFVW